MRATSWNRESDPEVMFQHSQIGSNSALERANKAPMVTWGKEPQGVGVHA